MRYLVRINPKALNPLTGKIIPGRIWEVEQCADKDSEKVIWHCADVRINKTPIRELFRMLPLGAPWEGEYFGLCLRAQDDVIEILTRKVLAIQVKGRDGTHTGS
jgi:hypothetical protein